MSIRSTGHTASFRLRTAFVSDEATRSHYTEPGVACDTFGLVWGEIHADEKPTLITGSDSSGAFGDDDVSATTFAHRPSRLGLHGPHRKRLRIRNLLSHDPIPRAPIGLITNPCSQADNFVPSIDWNDGAGEHKPDTNTETKLSYSKIPVILTGDYLFWTTLR
jgi:hypothetical protein